MKEPLWLSVRLVVLLHAETLAEHGGRSGIRDPGLLDSALTRPRNRFAYDQQADLTQLAAAYGFGLARNHAFVDGNKRIAFIATALFLRMNGYRLTSRPTDEIETFLKLAAGDILEDKLASWIRLNTNP